MAILAIYAASKGKFWEMNDLMYSIEKDFDISTIAEKIDINPAELSWALGSKEAKALLLRDIRDGFELGVTGTPSFEINGALYFGVIPPEVLNKIIQ